MWICLVILLGLVAHDAFADGSGSGSALGSGSAFVDSGSAIVTPADRLDDVLTAPVAALDDIHQAKRQGWVVLVLAVVTIAARALGKLGGKVKALAFLSKPSAALALGIVASLGAACYNAAVDGGSWMAIGTAAVLGFATWINAREKS